MPGFCTRCDDVVEVEYEEPKLRRWAKGYFLLGLPFIPAMPIIGSDFIVMLPLTMIYVIGFGPALGIIREPPNCCDCGAAVEGARST